MSNEIDELMARIDNDPSLATAKDIDDIIAYQRKARASYEAGIKPKKGIAEPVKIDLVKLGLVKAAEPFKRRV